jgi:hypothetical protein
MTSIPTTDTTTSDIRLGTADALDLHAILHLLIDSISDDDGRLNTCLLDFLAEHDHNPADDTRHLAVDLIRRTGGHRRMINPARDPDTAAIPDLAERAALNERLYAAGTDTGFWDERGNPAPWPDDIDEWRPVTAEPATTPEPGEQPF